MLWQLQGMAPAGEGIESHAQQRMALDWTIERSVKASAAGGYKSPPEIATTSTAKADATRVKSLEWGEDHPYPDAPWSKTYLHQRIGHHNLGRYAGSYSVFECPDGKWGWATTWDDTPRVLTGSFGTEAEAQAAAQADYEQRILSALQPASSAAT